MDSKTIIINNEKIDILQLGDENLLKTYEYLKHMLDQIDAQIQIVKSEAEERVRNKKKRIIAPSIDGKYLVGDFSSRINKQVNHTKLYELLKDRYDEVVTEKESIFFQIKKLKKIPTKKLIIPESKSIE